MTSPFAQNLVERIAAIQEEIDAEVFSPNGGAIEGSAANESVRVVLDGGDPARVSIDPALVDPNDVVRLESLVAQAIDDAARRLEESRTERITAAIRAMIDDLFVVPSGNDGR